MDGLGPFHTGVQTFDEIQTDQRSYCLGWCSSAIYGSATAASDLKEYDPRANLPQAEK